MGIVSEAIGITVGSAWKIGAIATLAGGLASSAYLGYEWHMAAHDRDVARADVDKVRVQNDALTNAIHDQNIAVTAMAAKTADAEQHRIDAEKKSANAIARITARGVTVSTSKATDCKGVLNEAWQGWK